MAVFCFVGNGRGVSESSALPFNRRFAGSALIQHSLSGLNSYGMEGENFSPKRLMSVK
jgi:hypothetical protein